jgi:hypothetical protein
MTVQTAVGSFGARALVDKNVPVCGCMFVKQHHITDLWSWIVSYDSHAQQIYPN